MHISEAGLDLIRAYEGLGDGDPSTVNLEPYTDHLGIWTLGWGYVLTTPKGQNIDARVFGATQARKLAKEAMQREFGKEAITHAEADALLRRKVVIYENEVLRGIGNAGATQAQFDALTSFTYNLGGANFRSSSVRRLHVQGNRTIGDVSLRELARLSKNKAASTTMAVAITRWSYSGGKWTLGLFRRRAAEMMVYGGHSLESALALTRNWRP